MMNIVAGYQTDLEMALNWLRLKKALQDVSEQRKEGNLYIATIRTKMNRSEVQKLLTDRFGHYVKVAPR
jgi:hypothetical protein